MSKTYKGYIKPTKPWFKQFTKKEVEKIFSSFENVFYKLEFKKRTFINSHLFDINNENATDKDLANLRKEFLSKNYKDFIYNKIHIPYPETDIWDDSIGIQPYQIKWILKYIELDSLEMFLETLSKVSVYHNRQFVEMGFYLPGSLFKDIFGRKKSLKKKSFNSIDFLMKTIGYTRSFKINGDNVNLEVNDSNFTLLSKDTNSSISFKKSELIVLIKENSFKFGKKTFEQILIEKKNLSEENYFNERSLLWMDKKGFSPINRNLLKLDPEFFVPKQFLRLLKKLYNVSNLKKISETETNLVVDIYAAFGNNTEDLVPIINIKNIDQKVKFSYETYKDPILMVNSFIKFVNIYKNEKIDLMSLSQVLKVLKSSEIISDFFENIVKPDKSDVSALTKLSYYKVDDESFSFLKKSKDFKSAYKIIKTGRIPDIEELKLNIKLFNKTKDITLSKHLRDIKGSINGISYEIVKKDDIQGILAGYHTDCCQHINSNGMSCVYYGAHSKDASFLIITKDNIVFAQSLVWTDSDTVVFDSVEYRGNDKDTLDTLKIIYKKVSESIIKKGIKHVNVGSNPLGFNKTSDNYASIPNLHFLLKDYDWYQLHYDESEEEDDEMYSDAHSQYKIK